MEESARGREAFGNAGCCYDDEAAVPLTDDERADIRLIRSIEKRAAADFSSQFRAFRT